MTGNQLATVHAGRDPAYRERAAKYAEQGTAPPDR